MDLLPLALNDFKDFFTLFPKCFSPFPQGTCSLSVLVQYLAFGEVHLRFALHYQRARLMRSQGYDRGANRRNGTIALHGVTFQSALSGVPRPPRDSCTTIPQLPVPSAADSSIGCSLFTRRYSGNHGCFLVLR